MLRGSGRCSTTFAREPRRPKTTTPQLAHRRSKALTRAFPRQYVRLDGELRLLASSLAIEITLPLLTNVRTCYIVASPRNGLINDDQHSTSCNRIRNGISHARPTPTTPGLTPPPL